MIFTGWFRRLFHMFLAVLTNRSQVIVCNFRYDDDSIGATVLAYMLDRLIA